MESPDHPLDRNSRLLRLWHPSVVLLAALGWWAGRGWPAALAFLVPALIGSLYLLALPFRIRRGKSVALGLGFFFLLLMGAAARAMIECFPGEGVPAGTGLLIHAATLMAVAIRAGFRS